MGRGLGLVGAVGSPLFPPAGLGIRGWAQSSRPAGVACALIWACGSSSTPLPHPRLRHISKPRTSSVIRAGKGHPSSGPPEVGGAQAGHLGCCTAGGRFPESPGTSPSGGERKRKGKVRRKEGTKNQKRLKLTTVGVCEASGLPATPPPQAI